MAIFDRIDSHALIHAAALSDGRGGAFLLAAPSGHGKSSLTLELTSRGRRFLSDDYAPLDLGRGTVSPYPRTVGLAPRGGCPVPQPFRLAAADPEAPQLFGKTLLDVGDVLGEHIMILTPLPLRHVILLDAGAGPTSTTLELTVRADEAGRVEQTLRTIEDVEVLGCRAFPRASTLTIRTPHDRPSGHRLATLLQDPALVSSRRLAVSRPDFAGSPQLSPIGRREAALHLCQELLNRREGGGLLARYEGRVPLLLLAVAGALREATCWRLTVGSFGEMVDTICHVTAPA